MLDTIRDKLIDLSGSNIPKALGLLAALAIFIAIFTAINLSGESGICHEAGYGDYDDKNGVCQVEGEYASGVIIVAGNTANTPTPEFKKGTVAYNYLKNSIAKQAKVKVISAASDLAVKDVSSANNETYDADGFIKAVDNVIGDINKQISAAPTAGGATYLEAIDKAGRDLASTVYTLPNDISEDKNNDGAAIIVIGSGLSDGGILNFAKNNYIDQTPDTVLANVNFIKQSDSLGSIGKVIWSGIGQVVKPQITPYDFEVDSLKNIYKGVLLTKGAKEIIFDDDSSRNIDSVHDNEHAVDKVELGAIVISHDELPFIAGTAKFADQSKATAIRSKVVDKYRAHENRISKIVVTGYMSPSNCAGDADTSLSGRRAEAVKALLTSGTDGIPSDKIIVKNGGIYNPGESICDADGHINEVIAQSKRKVIVEF